MLLIEIKVRIVMLVKKWYVDRRSERDNIDSKKMVCRS
jgi:hypothetical protein